MAFARWTLPTGLAWIAVMTVATVANILNNRLLPGAYLLTSTVSAGALLVVGHAAGLTWQQLGLGRGTWARGLRWAAAIAVLVTAVYAVGALLPLTRGMFDDSRVHTGSVGVLLFQTLVRIPLGTALLEEVLFRGVVLALAARSVGWTRGAVVSSLLFGVWHVLPSVSAAHSNPTMEWMAGHVGALGVPAAMLAAVVGTGLAGLAFCWLRIRAGSLLAPLGLHWSLNGLGYATAYLVRR